MRRLAEESVEGLRHLGTNSGGLVPIPTVARRRNLLPILPGYDISPLATQAVGESDAAEPVPLPHGHTARPDAPVGR